MTDLKPLTPENCDLRDFAFMPLDVVRLRDSDISAVSSGDEFRCAVLLWCASWHQVPAASLPDDDTVLSQLAGYGRVVKEWKKVKNGALRGWVKCSDGRLYHPVVAEKANEAWMRKLEQAWRTECGRIKKLNQRHEISLPFPTLEQFLSPDYEPPKAPPVPDLSRGTLSPCPSGQDHHVPDLSPGKCTPIDSGQGQGQGQGHSVNPISEVTYSEPEPPPDDPLPDHATTRRKGELCKALRPLNIDAMPHLQCWEALLQHSDDEILFAAQSAKARKPNERISLAYLVPILADKGSTPKPRGPAWWATENGILAKGRELGIEARVGETMPEFKARINAKIEIAKGATA